MPAVLPTDHPARLRAVDLLPLDQPLKPHPPVHRWRYSPGVRLAVFAGTTLVALAALLGIGTVPPVADLIERHWWLARLQQVAAVVAGFVALLWCEQRRPVELALRRWSGLLWGLLLGAGLCTAVIVALFALGSYRVLGVDPGYQVLPALVSTGLVAAVAEEIVFRGVLFRLGEDLLGTWAAVGASAAVFGLAHAGNPGATLWGACAIALEAGVLFGALYALTRSLWWCIGLHFSWNMLQGPVFGSVVSGSGSSAGWLRAEFPGPVWLTGGDFGIEASVVTVGLLTAVAVVLLRVVHRDGITVLPSWVRRRRLQESLTGNA